MRQILLCGCCSTQCYSWRLGSKPYVRAPEELGSDCLVAVKVPFSSGTGGTGVCPMVPGTHLFSPWTMSPSSAAACPWARGCTQIMRVRSESGLASCELQFRQTRPWLIPRTPLAVGQAPCSQPVAGLLANLQPFRGIVANESYLKAVYLMKKSLGPRGKLVVTRITATVRRSKHALPPKVRASTAWPRGLFHPAWHHSALTPVSRCPWQTGYPKYYSNWLGATEWPEKSYYPKCNVKCNVKASLHLSSSSNLICHRNARHY